MRNTTWTGLLLVGALALGCDGERPDPDGGPTEDGGPGDSGQPPDTGPGGDGNDTFAEADPIEVGTPAEDRSIATPGDLDYYSFAGTAGQWIVITTTATPETNMLDTVLTLYDASMTKIAENDDAQPRGTGATATNSEIITRLPADGTYYVLVQEFSSWDPDETPEGMSSFRYTLSVAPLNVTADVVNEDAEGGDDAASAQALTFNNTTDGDFNVTVGTFEDATDVDVYSFNIAADRRSIRFVLMPVGSDGYGSTTTPARMWVTNADGSEIIARIDPAALAMPQAPADVNPPLPAGDYLFWVDAGPAGANDFYVIKTYRSPTDNDPETMETENDVAATAEAITLEAVTGTPEVRRRFVLSMLPDGDTDHYSVALNDGEALSVYCGSRTGGSGVVDLTAAVLDATGATELATATETATEPIALEDAVTASGATTYLVRLTKASQDAEVTGDWARCQIRAAPPASP